MLLPMDEALILTAVDLSGRGMLYWDMHIPTPKVGSFDRSAMDALSQCRTKMPLAFRAR